jgi:hypothetical protein
MSLPMSWQKRLWEFHKLQSRGVYFTCDDSIKLKKHIDKETLYIIMVSND